MKRTRWIFAGTAVAALAAAATALAIKTNLVEIGRDSAYDGKVRIERDATGNMTFADEAVTTPVLLLSLLGGAGSHGAQAGLGEDGHPQYLNEERHEASHGSTFNSAMPMGADVNGNPTIGAHAGDGAIHLNRNSEETVPGAWKFSGTPEMRSDLRFSAAGSPGTERLIFENGSSDAQMEWDPGDGQFEFNRAIKAPGADFGSATIGSLSFTGSLSGSGAGTLDNWAAISGIATDNLLDKTADEDVSGRWDFLAPTRATEQFNGPDADRALLSASLGARPQSSGPLTGIKRTALRAEAYFENEGAGAIADGIVSAVEGHAQSTGSPLAGEEASVAGLVGRASTESGNSAALGAAGFADEGGASRSRIGVLGGLDSSALGEPSSLPGGPWAGYFLGDLGIAGHVYANGIRLDGLDTTRTRTLVVAPEGGDFNSIGAALERIAESPGSSRWVVILSPAVYEETDLILPPYVTLRAAGARQAVIQGSTSGAILTLQGFNSLDGIAVHNSGGGDACRAGDGSGSPSDLLFLNCELAAYGADGAALRTDESDGGSGFFRGCGFVNEAGGALMRIANSTEATSTTVAARGYSFEHCDFRFAGADAAEHVGIDVAGEGDVAFLGCRFFGVFDGATLGGAIFRRSGSDAGETFFDGCEFSLAGLASGVAVYGVELEDAAVANLTGCRFSSVGPATLHELHAGAGATIRTASSTWDSPNKQGGAGTIVAMEEGDAAFDELAARHLSVSGLTTLQDVVIEGDVTGGGFGSAPDPIVPADGTQNITGALAVSGAVTMADDRWSGLGATAGRIEFDDQGADEVNILGANVGIGTQAPGSILEVNTGSGTGGAVKFLGTAGNPTKYSFEDIGSNTNRMLRFYGGNRIDCTTSDGSTGVTMVLGASSGAETQLTGVLRVMGATITHSSAAPQFDWSDTTSSAKDLRLLVDADKAYFYEAAGSAGQVLGMDLANNRVSIGSTTFTSQFNVGSSAQFQVNSSGNIAATGSGTQAFGGNLQGPSSWQVDPGSGAGGTLTLGVGADADAVSIGGGAGIKKALSATATLDFPDTAGTFGSDLTMTVSGAALGDAVFLGIPHGSTGSGGEGTAWTAWVSAADTVTVRFTNAGVGNVNPASGTYRAVVFKF